MGLTMIIRIKIDCVVEVPGDVLPFLNQPLDLIEHGVTFIKATEILPGAKVSLSRTKPRESVASRTDKGRRVKAP